MFLRNCTSFARRSMSTVSNRATTRTTVAVTQNMTRTFVHSTTTTTNTTNFASFNSNNINNNNNNNSNNSAMVRNVNSIVQSLCLNSNPVITFTGNLLIDDDDDRYCVYPQSILSHSIHTHLFFSIFLCVFHRFSFRQMCCDSLDFTNAHRFDICE